MTDMVELPRNPLDFVIDSLSDPAFQIAWGLKYGALEATNVADPITANELVDAGLARHAGGIMKDGEQTAWCIEATFDGQFAGERLRCGIYFHHKEIYAKREARDAAKEANPLYGMFG